MSEIRRVCVYCGSRPGHRPAYAEAARQLAALLARAGVGIVNGGGHVGLMGVVADAALAEGGEVIGVIPQVLYDLERGHTGLTELHVVATMHERKALMADLADAFVALPGGLGTLEEIAEALTWVQLGIHAKPCAFLDVDGFYAPFVRFLDHMVEEGFVLEDRRAAIWVESEPEALVARLTAPQAEPM